MILVGHTEFQGCGSAQDFLCPGGVLHSRQLHDHALQSLLLDDRFGHAQFVHTFAQGGDVLLQGQAPGLLYRVLAESGKQGKLVALGLGLLQFQVGKIILYLDDTQPALFGIPEPDEQAVIPAPGDGPVADPLVPQLRPDIRDVTLFRLGNRRFHIHLHEEMHAAAQIQTQEHGFGAQRAQPARRRRGQVKGHGVGTAQPFLDHVLGLELGSLVCKPDHQAALTHADVAVLDARRVQGVFHGIPGEFADLATPRCRDLQCRVLAVDIRQREQATDRNDGDDQEVFPDRVTVHGLLTEFVIPCVKPASEGFQRSLGQDRANGLFLHLNLGALGNFEHDEIIAHLVDLPQHAAIGRHFIAFRQVADQLLVLPGLLHLRPDQEEVKNDEEQDHHEQEGTASALSAALRPCVVYEEIDHRSGAV